MLDVGVCSAFLTAYKLHMHVSPCQKIAHQTQASLTGSLQHCLRSTFMIVALTRSWTRICRPLGHLSQAGSCSKRDPLSIRAHSEDFHSAAIAVGANVVRACSQHLLPLDEQQCNLPSQHMIMAAVMIGISYKLSASPEQSDTLFAQGDRVANIKEALRLLPQHGIQVTCR